MKKYVSVFILTIILIIFQTTATKNSVMAGEIELLFNKARNEYYAGNLDKSKELYNLILNKDEDNKEAIQNLIIINKELGNMEETSSQYRKLLSFENNNSYLMYNYGIVLYQSGKLEEAREVLSKILEKENYNILANYEYATIYYYLGEIESELGSYKEAIKFYNTGVNYYPANVINYLGKAEIFYRQNKYQKALEEYNSALRRDSSLSYLYPDIAICYEKINNPELAYIYWQKSAGSGIKVNLAEERMEDILIQFPEIEVEKEEERKMSTDVKWLDLQQIEQRSAIPLLRIGLLDNISEIMFKSKTDFNVTNNGEIILKGHADDLWRIIYENKYFLLYQNNELVKKIKSNGLNIDTDQFVIFNITYGQGYFWAGSENRQYRGKIELAVDENNKFSLINIITVEEYLFSVVPSEIPSWWPEEALKAQSLAARTYALKNCELNRHKLYDLCDGVHCAVYNGVNVENKRAKEAVIATRGEVITINGKLINSVFSSNSGGYSESSSEIWGTDVEYLQGKYNNNDKGITFPLSPYELNNWLKNQKKPKYYSHFSGSNTYRWIKKIPVKYFIEKYNLNSLKEIIVCKRSKGGSVVELIIKGEDRDIKVKQDSIRSALAGLKSNRFFIEKTYDKNGNIKELIIYGSGWGHSVGMDQTAAAGMAEHGFNYKEVIKHFYNNTVVEKIY